MRLRTCKALCRSAKPVLQCNRQYGSASQPNLSAGSPPPNVIFSGIQPTGVPHLGNYLGALQPWKQLQDNASSTTKLIFCLVDLHALTTQPAADRLRQWKRDALAALLAVGLDPQRCTIFFQSEVSAHAELMWTLSCSASIGYLSRMTQWKSKLALSDATSIDDAAAKAKLRLGLFSYPVLQAADVLVHDATQVPVGEDQKQHLEFARECAQIFNRQYGPGLVVPEVLISPAKRVMSLTDPLKKMSKSTGPDQSRLLLTDGPEDVQSKIMRALTDSEPGITYDPIRRPGIANLLEIAGHLEGISPQAVCARYRDVSLRALKADISRILTLHMTPIRERLSVLQDPKQGAYLDEVAFLGRHEASLRSRRVLDRVYALTGLR